MFSLVLVLCLLEGICQARRPPSATIFPKNKTVKLHSSAVTFTCSADGDPTPTVTWFKNDLKIKTGTQGYIISPQTFTILAVQWSDEGQIACEATNAFGTKRDTAYLKVISGEYAPRWTQKPYNMTLYKGQAYTIPCKAVGFPKPVYTWTKGGLDISMAGVTALESGKLQFSDAKLYSHTGQYTCTAANYMGSIVTSVYVQVVKDPSIVIPPRGSSVLSGVAVNMSCRVAGSPRSMSIRWSKDGASLPVKGTRIHVWSVKWRSMNIQTIRISNVTIKDSGQYQCTVRNKKGISNSEPAILTVNKPSVPQILALETNMVIMKGFSVTLKCLFTGVPKPEITWHNKGTMLQRQTVSVKHRNSTFQAELRISNAQHKDTGKFICRAQNAYGMAEDHISLSVKGIPDTPTILQVNQTSSMTIIILWDLRYGGADNFTIEYRQNNSLTWEELVTVPGHFRNVTLSRDEGWGKICFRVTAANKYGQSMPSDKILLLGKGSDKKQPGEVDSQGINVGAVAGGVTAGTLLVVMVTILLIIFLKRRKNKPGRSESSAALRTYSTIRRAAEQPIEEAQIYDESESSYMYVTTRRTLPTRQESLYASVPREARWEVPKRNVSLMKQLGAGHFGKVMKGHLKTRKGIKIVAVKMLKKCADEEQRWAFLAELELMKSIAPHPNIVGLVGSCTKSSDPYIIVEYCSLGNLLDFLRQSINAVVYANLAANSASLTWRDLLSFAWQVTRGMSYLASQNLVHRDLAARNVLVDKGYNCKIADFGLARDIYVEKQYVKRTQAELPLRWMSYESIYSGITTTESDVWSFGILLWEIVTLGANPYPGMSSEEVINGIHNGYRMPKPPFCSDSLYSVMWECWQLEPSARPTFPELSKTIYRLMRAQTICINLSNFSVKYANSNANEA